MNVILNSIDIISIYTLYWWLEKIDYIEFVEQILKVT